MTDSPPSPQCSIDDCSCLDRRGFSSAIRPRVQTSGGESIFLIWHQDQMSASPAHSHREACMAPSACVSEAVSLASGKERCLFFRGLAGADLLSPSRQPPSLRRGLSIASSSSLFLVRSSGGFASNPSASPLLPLHPGQPRDKTHLRPRCLLGFLTLSPS